MRIEQRAKSNHKWAIVIGTGLALSPIHNAWLTESVTTGGVVGFFIPAFGTALWLMGALLFLVWSKQKIDWGDKRVLVPLLVVVASMGLSGAINGDSLTDKFAPLLMGISLLALYLTSRVLGKDILLPIALLAMVVAASCIYQGIANPGELTGGLITNYCASAGFMLFGVLVIRSRWQWTMVAVVVMALFFVGALEGLFALCVMGTVVLARRDWGKRLLLPVGLVVVIAIVWAASGHLVPLWAKVNLLTLRDIATGNQELNDDSLEIATTGRWSNIVQRMGDIQPLGRGYWVVLPYRANAAPGYYEYSNPDLEPVHNVPLVIVDQVGPVAGLAWLFITLFCLIKTRWKYAWTAVVALSVFDHFIWTQFAPFWWALAGVSLTSDVKSDLIFRRVSNARVS